MSQQTQQQLDILLQSARRNARGAYSQRLRQYEAVKQEIIKLALTGSEYAQAIRKLANALNI